MTSRCTLPRPASQSHRGGHAARCIGVVWIAAVLFAAASPAWAQPSPDVIRVAIARNDPEVTLWISGPFTMTALTTGVLIDGGRHLPTTAIRAAPNGLALGQRIVPYSGVRFEPSREAGISLNGKRLRGALEITRQQDATLLVVNHVGLEDYLRGVLSKEAPDYWPAEALKAIAIAARTYALYQRFTKAPSGYDVTGDVMSQEYGGHTGEKRATTQAVQASAGLIVTYQGQLFPTFYHSTCGGMTEHARVMGNFDLAPLQGGTACTLCQGSPFFHWQRRLTKADVGWALRRSPYGSIGAVSEMRVTKRTARGRAEEVTVVGAARTLKLSGYDVRALFGFDRIRSPFFTIQPEGAATFLLDGHGWGHGVGLCQWGAAELARRGFSAREILGFYYPHADVASVQEWVSQPIRVIGGGS